MIRPFGGRQAAVDWLIVGLGNPGRQYAGTRHSVGFLVADALAERWGLPKPKQRFRGRIAEGRVRPEAPALGTPTAVPQVAVLWPRTYMNEAGLSVGPARGSYKLPLDRLLVVHDEIDLPFGEIRTRLGGGLAGHNGLKSLKRELGGGDFWRVRVGVGRPDSTDPEIVAAYVLGRFRESPAEVRELVDGAAMEVERRVLEGSEEGDAPARREAPGRSSHLPHDPAGSRPPHDPAGSRPPHDPAGSRPPHDPAGSRPHGPGGSRPHSPGGSRPPDDPGES